jgi:medium-chain acyl-[acyl-carrier-protein] hydrolase
MLPPAIEVCAIQLPGRENRIGEPLFTNLQSLVDALAEGLRSDLQLPFAFIGHSMGALVGFALACELSARKLPEPAQLFVSGFRAPQLPDPEPAIHALPEPRFLDEIQRLNGTPPEVLGNRELLELMIPILRADFTICETYQHRDRRQLSCPILAIGGAEDEEVGYEELAAWREQTSGRFSLVTIPGDHFYIDSARTQLLDMVARELAWLLRPARGARL